MTPGERIIRDLEKLADDIRGGKPIVATRVRVDEHGVVRTFKGVVRWVNDADVKDGR